MSIASNASRIQEQIAQACRKCGRPESDVALMAVSKLHPAESIAEAWSAGLRLFGENRVQEWQQKEPLVAQLNRPPDQLRIHLIGPLQSNKTGRAAELFDSVDSVESLRIAMRLNQAAIQLNKRLPILIEVKLSSEESKHGVSPDELPELLEQLTQLTALLPSGLMTVPPWSEVSELARPYFRQLRQLRDKLVIRCPTLTQLSMGMSNDFAVAIEEGSTCVRIGTALFGKRQLPERAHD
jgi:PLP dependent protein